ncbi:TPA: hypothetical protein DIV55_06450 [Patescibacteria group bacterium]|uniref:Fimbrial protein pilin n=1 Tax=Candidatus Curtissbacteria bacterium GW2011_GWA1_40_16 TaxID=1618405 RepID=A0A0G0UKW3_9BACT|nr:MAG: fimbrial protein pilin [Candidatus Curtissbacteria bacterium GW2011_GWA1_40_16]HCS79346.1 hypothetical protein [Patescibacteria group bacterium]
MPSARSLLSKIYHLKSGFTLIELLVVISIIAILISAAMVSFSVAQTKGRDGKRKADLKGIQQALEQYYQANGHYPVTSGGKMQCNTTTDTTTVTSWGGTFICGGTTYMKPVPKDPAFDPSSNKDYYYDSAGSNSYKLSATVENKNDSENTDNPNYSLNPTLPCDPTVNGRTYCVINP